MFGSLSSSLSADVDKSLH